MSGVLARRTPCASLFLSVAAVILLLPALVAPLQYDRAAIADGEIWRLLSGHWVHSSFDHFFWDVLAFGCLGAACELRGRRQFLVCVVVSAIAISLTIWLALPEMSVYRGLSGIDSALFGLLFVELLRDGIRARKPDQVAFAVVCFLAFALKISYELIAGRNVFVEAAGFGWVGVPLAHIAGASVGVAMGSNVTFRRGFVISE
jgi:rhomboid family GlyGly-CTERM serine protease